MPEVRHTRESTVRGEQSAPGASKCCAYNRTRERFLSADVEAGDFPAEGLDVRLANITPGSGVGLWMFPFRGISPTSVRAPLDLIYLDRNSVVIEAVEMFPISTVSATSRPAASVLALPANTIASIGTQAGDQLILCPPEEMKQRLRELLTEKTDAQAEAAGGDPAMRAGTAVGSTTGSARVLPWVGRSRTRPESEILPAYIEPVEIEPISEQQSAAPSPVLEPSPQPSLAPKPSQAPGLAEPDPNEAVAQKAKPARGWLSKLLSPDPPEPRKAQREAMPGLSAYFFTGGESVAHGVRDISRTGFYIFTGERWYPGTILRMTLTERGRGGVERSITVNATAVRWGNDGVGLNFVFQDAKDLRRGVNPQMDGMLGGATKAQVAEFLNILKSGPK